MKIFKAIPAIMAEMSPIGKERKNTAQGYSFRGIDDVYNALQSVMAKHGVFPVPTVLEDRTEERTTNKGSVLIYRVLKISYRFYADDGSFFDAVVIGEGMDSGDKASNKAMSVAEKYALIQVFCIPTAEAKDPENDSHEVRARIENDDTSKQALAQMFEDLGIEKEKWPEIGRICMALDPRDWFRTIKDYMSKTRQQ